MAIALLTVFYNIALTAVLALAACCTYFLYHQQKRPILIALCMVFGAYLLDNTIVFCTEIIPEFASLYDEMFLETPSIKTVYFITLIGSLMYALHCALPAFSMKQMGLLIALYATLLICVPMVSQHDWMVFLYYFNTQLLVIVISGWGLVAIRKTESSFDRGLLKRIFLYFLCMSILVLAEDSFVIFFVDRYTGPKMKIHNRNLSENVLYLGLALPIFHYSLNQLKQIYDHTDDTVPSDAEPETTVDPIPAFAEIYNLTDREQEILVLLLQSKSQQEISDELVIALGTVKTHIHNIYHKTGSANRSQFMAKYQQFCDS